MDTCHGPADLISDTGDEFSKGGEFFALDQVVPEAVDTRIGMGKMLKRAEQACGKKILLN